MFQYVVRRLLLAVAMLLGAMSIVFFAMRILPGDPCMALMGDQATRDALKDCVRDLGLDRPVVVQYGEFLWKSVRLDFGLSFRQHYRVTDYILRMFPYTFTLVLASMVIALAIGLPTGILSALKRRNPLLDYSVRIIALLGLSMPVFWFGILLLIMFSLRFDLFPYDWWWGHDHCPRHAHLWGICDVSRRFPCCSRGCLAPSSLTGFYSRHYPGGDGKSFIALGHARGD